MQSGAGMQSWYGKSGLLDMCLHACELERDTNAHTVRQAPSASSWRSTARNVPPRRTLLRGQAEWNTARAVSFSAYPAAASLMTPPNSAPAHANRLHGHADSKRHSYVLGQLRV